MRRALRIIALTLLAPILLFAAIIQIDQHLLRHRAEQLNADLQPLMRRPATWEDLQRIQTRWGRYAHYEGICNRDHCAYRIVLNSLPDSLSPRSWLSQPPNWSVPPWLMRLYVFFGGNGSYIQADLRLTNNHLWGISFHILSGPDSRSDFGNILFARFVFGPRLFSYSYGDEEISARKWKDGYITDFPGSCTGCVGGYTSVTPFTPADQFDRLTKIDFSCLTRYISCQAVSQILPAWKREPYDEANWGDPHCLVPLDVRAREIANILLLEVTGNALIPDEKPARWENNVHILAKLKNAPNQQAGANFAIAEMSAFLNPAPPPRPSETAPWPPLATGGRYVVLYPEERHFMSITAPPEPDYCSVAVATPENLALIQTGIAQDPSIGEPYHLPY